MADGRDHLKRKIMKRRLCFTSFCLLFGGSVFGQNGGKDNGRGQNPNRDQNYNEWDRSGKRDHIEWAVQNKNATGNDGRSMNIRVINLSLGHRPYESTA